MRIYNTIGELVWQNPHAGITVQIDICSWMTGIYTVVVNSGEQINYSRLVHIQR